MCLKDYDFRNASVALKEYVTQPEYRDLQRGAVHGRLSSIVMADKQATEKYVASEAELQQIHDGILMHQRAKLNAEDYLACKERFDREIWPKISARAKHNPGMVQFLREYGVFSDLIAPFLVNVWECPAKAVLPAHGIGENIMGDPVVIAPLDPMFPFCYDQSYRMIQGRAEAPQETMKRSKRVLLAGGGLAPELWVNNFPLGETDTEYVIVDIDPNLPKYLERILGKKLSDYNITCVQDDIVHFCKDEANWCAFDCLVANGFMSYHTRNPEELEEIFEGFANVLRAGGKLFFDVQLKHGVLLFDVLVLEWPAEMDTLDGYQVAVDLITPYLVKYGFVNARHSTETYDPDKGETPAGMFTMAEKNG